MAETIRVTGLRELQAALAELPRRMTRRVLNAALMRGAAPIVKTAKARAPVLKQPDPRRIAGNLAKNIRARPVSDPTHTAAVAVGVRKLSVKQIGKFKAKTGKGGSANPSDPFYWRFSEFPAAGKPLQRFLGPAFEAEKRGAVDIIKQGIADRIEIEAAKLARKA